MKKRVRTARIIVPTVLVLAAPGATSEAVETLFVQIFEESYHIWGNIGIVDPDAGLDFGDSFDLTGAPPLDEQLVYRDTMPGWPGAVSHLKSASSKVPAPIVCPIHCHPAGCSHGVPHRSRLLNSPCRLFRPLFGRLAPDRTPQNPCFAIRVSTPAQAVAAVPPSDSRRHLPAHCRAEQASV